MEFLCSKCGACCRAAGKMNGAKYGLPIKKDGSCAHLVGNECSIYEHRPSICRVSNMTHKSFYQSKKSYFIQATKRCHELIDEEGLNSSYKINIKEYNV
jgi:Fe-S-cluster containining protein